MTDTTTPDQPLVPDGWELLAGGRACLWLDGRPHRLKAPKLGELRRISEMVRETSDATTEMAHKLNAEVAEVEDPAVKADLNRARTREFSDSTQSAWWELLQYIADALGGGLPSEEDVPAWVVTDAMNEVSALVRHFQTAPPPRGGRP